MTALVWALGAALVLASGAVLTLALLSRKDGRELVLASKALRDTERVSAEWEHKYHTEVVTHGVAIKAREQEQTRRLIAEANLKEAQRRAAAYLAQNLRGATKDEVNAVLADVFSSGGLSLVPQPEASRATEDDLLNPFATDV